VRECISQIFGQQRIDHELGKKQIDKTHDEKNRTGRNSGNVYDSDHGAGHHGSRRPVAFVFAKQLRPAEPASETAVFLDNRLCDMRKY
jgi:hypothetical protein